MNIFIKNIQIFKEKISKFFFQGNISNEQIFIKSFQKFNGKISMNKSS